MKQKRKCKDCKYWTRVDGSFGWCDKWREEGSHQNIKPAGWVAGCELFEPAPTTADKQATTNQAG